MFHHGYTGYLKHAYPADELRPISCAPLERDPDPTNVGINDIHANISMTLVDSLSALPLILPTAYPDALEKVSGISFDQDVKVQVRAASGRWSCCAWLDSGANSRYSK